VIVSGPHHEKPLHEDQVFGCDADQRDADIGPLLPFAGVDNDAGFGTRVAGNSRAFDECQAALRWA
jgi:hypothetical protein